MARKQLKTQKEATAEEILAKENALDRFIAQVRGARSVDFPKAAKLVGLDYFVDIEPALVDNVGFRQKLERALKEIRFELIDSALDVGINGKSEDTASLSYIKEVLKMIDDGLLSGAKGEANELSPEALSEHRSRLGLSLSGQADSLDQNHADAEPHTED